MVSRFTLVAFHVVKRDGDFRALPHLVVDLSIDRIIVLDGVLGVLLGRVAL